MTGPKSKKRQKNPWSMHPKLHDDVQRLLEEDGLEWAFHDQDNQKGCINEYSTHIMGRFACHKKECLKRGWGSKKVAILIRRYEGNRYNAVVYHQRCEKCNSLSIPKLNDSYAERVADRIKRWAGIELERPPYSKKQGLPHKSHLCEGCKAGRCELGRS
ncbi:hypothetical protein NLU13_3969 [Sarocladium strictum]|uniref:3CxxC-type domain-containing protein n=1 Tax=Sarocladium strictum TaxID=5046 RepID=A0AA39L8H6_SARSR|nr:hypothetical protein NLU13_3969 [Sarocladium strictum]